MNISKDKTTVLIATHFNYRTEKNEDTDSRLLNFLKDKVKRIVLIAQPFPEFGHRYSYLLVYGNGKKVKESKVYIFNGPAWLQFLYHILTLYYFLFKEGVYYDLCISMENLSFVSILPLKLVGFIKRLVYYSIDFVPQRFPNPLLNWVYHFMDKLGFKFSDTSWVMTDEQFKKRVVFGIKTSNSNPVNIVPIGYDINKIITYPLDKIDLNNLIYTGAMRESTGPELTIKTMPLLIRKNPKIHLTLMGAGNDTDKLKALIKKLKLTKHVDFLGYISDFYELTEIMAKGSIGLAPYKPISESFSFFSDPSKIKLYMCCGLPVVTTDMTTMSDLITKTKSGVIINYSEEALSKAILFLLEDKKRYASYKKAATQLSKEFDVNHILNSAIKKIPN